jgi:hypothetical protein
MKYNPYKIYQNGLSDKQWRKDLIEKLEREWPEMCLGLHNGRKLNRLSTRQIEAKIYQHNRIVSEQRTAYLKSLDSPSRQQHLIRFTAVHKISLLNTLHLVGATA